MAISQLYPNSRPTLNLNFARSKTLDPRITFTRNSTATYVGSDGLIKTAAAGEARFDHNGNGDSLGLLIEESRTNEQINSADFANNSSWIMKNSYTRGSNTTEPAPDGTNTACEFFEVNGAGSFNGVRATPMYLRTVSSGRLTVSVFNKPINNDTFMIMPSDTGSAVANCTSIINNTWSYNSSFVESATSEPAGNGWYRLSATFIVATSAQWYRPVFSSQMYAGPNETPDATQGCTLWGAQVEEGKFPTSYIPTSGSTVTRNDDEAEITGTNFSSWYNQSEGTLFVKSINHGGSRAPFALALNTQNFPMVELGENASSTNAYVLRVFNTVGAQADITATVNAFGTSNTYAGAIKTDNFAVSVNGGTPLTDTSGELVTTFNTLRIGRQWNRNTYTGTISRFAYYPYRLTDSQLQELTS